MERIIKILLSTIVILFAQSGIVAQQSPKDSILSIITNAKQEAHMNSIGITVGPKIHALNNWANNAMWNQPDLVKEVAEDLIQYAIQNNNDSLLSWAYHYIGLSYYNMHYWNMSINIYNKVLETKWAKNAPTAKSFRAFCALNIGCNYEYLGDYDMAAKYYYKSIRLNEELGVPYVAAEAKLDVASLNIRMNNFNEAQKNIFDAIGILEQFNDSVRISDALRMLSIIEISNNNYSKANDYFEQALAISIELNDQERLVRIYQDYGDALFDQNRWLEAKNTYEKALEYCSPRNFPATYFRVIGSLGKVQFELNQFSKAENNLLFAHSELNKLQDALQLLEIEKTLTKFYAKTGNYDLFMRYYNLSMARKDALAAIEKYRSIGESEVIYKTAQKDRQIVFQSILLSSRKKQILLVLMVSLLLLFGLILVIVLLKRLRIKKRVLLERNIELSRQWEKIQGSYFSNDSSGGESQLFKEIYELVVEQSEFKNPKLSVDFLAKELNTNSKYISTAIREKTSMNFNSFVNTFRTERAKELLRIKESNKWSLETIAEECGFNNNTTFYKTFKLNTGLTPSVYRKIPS